MAKLLTTGAKLKTVATKNGLKICVPVTSPNQYASVIKLEVKGKVVMMKTTSPGRRMESGALD